jgi:hypothetical protein
VLLVALPSVHCIYINNSQISFGHLYHISTEDKVPDETTCTDSTKMVSTLQVGIVGFITGGSLTPRGVNFAQNHTPDRLLSLSLLYRLRRQRISFQVLAQDDSSFAPN